MAAVFDINILCKEMIDLPEEWLKNRNIVICSASSIDNWKWENEQTIADQEQARRALRNGKVISVRMKKSGLRDLGVFVEICDRMYVYDIWMNTEGYDEIDYETIDSKNVWFYNRIYDGLRELKCSGIEFELVGMGVETDFCCSDDLQNVLRKSRHIVSWIVRDNVDADRILTDYKKRNTENFIFYEKC